MQTLLLQSCFDTTVQDIGIYDGSDLTQAISVPEKETNKSVHGESVVSLASSRSQDICDAGIDGEKPDCVVQLLQELGLQVSCLLSKTVP